MGAKEELLEDLKRQDTTRTLGLVHDKLVALGLKWRKSSNTLMYDSKENGESIGIAALRYNVFSFPKNYWNLHTNTQTLKAALAKVPSYRIVRLEPGISSSQQSAGQIQLHKETVEAIMQIIDETLVPIIPISVES